MNIHIRGNATGFQFMQNSPGGQQQQTVTSEQKEAALAALLPWLAQVIAQGKLQREVCARATGRTGLAQGPGRLPNPKWPVIGAVAGCAGDPGRRWRQVLAAQALGWLTILIGEFDCLAAKS